MVDLQSTNRTKISKVRETTFNTIPTSPAFKARRVTSHNLSVNPQTVVSNEIRSDRQVADLILVGEQAGGASAGELAFRVADDDLEEALQSSWALTPERDNAGTADSVITAVATTNTEVTHLTGAAFVASLLVLFSGFGVAGNNGVFKCTTGGALTSRYVGSGITDEAAPAANARMKVVGFRGASGDLVAVASGTKITSTSLDFTTLGLAVGQRVRFAGWTNTPANNDYCRISAIAAHVLTLDRVPTGWGDDAGTSTVVDAYFGDTLVNGATKRSSTFERQYLDHNPVTYEYLSGQTLDKLSLSITAQAVVTFSEDWMGASGAVSSTRASGATDSDAPANDVLNASSNVGSLSFNGSLVSSTPNFIQSLTLDIANNLRRQNAIGSLAAIGIGNGEFTVTGTLNSYFGSKAILDLLIANSRAGLEFAIGRTDSNNESYFFDMPSIKLSSGSPQVSGKNADVMINAGFQALRDPTLGYTLHIDRFWYLS